MKAPHPLASSLKQNHHSFSDREGEGQHPFSARLAEGMVGFPLSLAEKGEGCVREERGVSLFYKGERGIIPSLKVRRKVPHPSALL